MDIATGTAAARRPLCAPAIVAGLAITLGWLAPTGLEARQGGLQITSVSAPDTIARYGRFEVTFDVAGSVATNPQMPHDPAPPPGIPAGWGITVNAEFSRDGFQTVHRIPAFYYQDYDYQVKGNRDWFHALDQFA